jgi:hypothetical protein
MTTDKNMGITVVAKMWCEHTCRKFLMDPSMYQQTHRNLSPTAE